MNRANHTRSRPEPPSSLSTLLPGEVLWSAECGGWPFVTSADVFGIDGLIWTVGDADFSLVGFDADTGKVKKTIDAAEAFYQGHHHRCYRNKATSRYIFTGRRGIESTELATRRRQDPSLDKGRMSIWDPALQRPDLRPSRRVRLLHLGETGGLLCLCGRVVRAARANSRQQA